MPGFSRFALVGLLLGAGLLPSLALAQPADPVPSNACTRGSSGIGDGYFPFMGNAGYDIRHYALDLDLDVAAGSIRVGSATILATAILDLCAFNLDFNGLEIDAVAVDGVPAEWRRNGQELTIAPARPLARGGDFVVAVRYHGEPLGTDAPSVAEVVASLDPGATPAADGPPEDGDPAAEAAAEGFGLPFSPDADRYGWSIGGWWRAGPSVFVVGEPRGAEFWYPVNGHPADKATYAIALTVDDPYAAVANGPLVETIDGEGQTTFVYAPRDPMSSYLVTLQAGELDIVEDATADGLPLRYAFAEGVPQAQRDLFVEVQPEILAFFAERFGPYPFDLAGASVVAAPLPFALETQTMPTYGAMLDLPEAGSTIDEAALAGLAETIAHETAHQWFGNAVSPLRWEDVFLNEGFAQYSAYLWVEERDGPEVMERRLRASYDRLASSVRLGDPTVLATATGSDILAPLGPLPDEVVGALLDLAGAESPAALDALPATRVLAALEAFGVPLGAVLGDGPVLTGDPGPDDLFSVPYVYERGALTMHALRRAVGDETFFVILRQWAATYGGGNATVQDFVAHAEAVSGQNLDPLFDGWLYRLALPPFPE